METENDYKPGCSEHDVLHTFRKRLEFVPELDFVMEKDGKLISQVMYVRTVIQKDDGAWVDRTHIMGIIDS